MPKRRKPRKYGTVYILHLDTSLSHARHYTGFTTNLPERLAAHEAGQGARLMEVVKERGITFRLARTWDRVTRNFERQLKNRKNMPRYCPICCARGEATRCAKREKT